MPRLKVLTALLAIATLSMTGACSSGADSDGGTGTTSAVVTTTAAGTDSGTVTDDPATGDAATTGSPDTQQTGGPSESSAAGGDLSADGVLDPQTAAWFGTFCSSLVPVIESGQSVDFGEPGPSNPAGDLRRAQQSFVEFFGELGQAMTTTANTLRTMNPPAIAHGATIADDVIAALAESGPGLVATAAELKAATITSGDELSAALQDASKILANGMGALGANKDIAPEIGAAITDLPECAPLSALAGGPGE